MNMKNLKTKPIAALAVVFLIALSCLATTNLAKADAPAATGTIAVDINNSGSDVTLDATAVGDQLTVELEISGASNVWSWFTDISWNDDVIELAEVHAGENFMGVAYIDFFLAKSPDCSTLFIGDNDATWKVDGTTGYINGGISNTRTVGTATTNTGGVIATLVFDIVGTGDTDIDLSNAKVTNVDEVQSSAGMVDGYLVVGAPFVVPEYNLGALAALVTAFAAFGGVLAFKKGFSFPTFSKRVA